MPLPTGWPGESPGARGVTLPRPVSSPPSPQTSTARGRGAGPALGSGPLFVRPQHSPWALPLASFTSRSPGTHGVRGEPLPFPALSLPHTVPREKERWGGGCGAGRSALGGNRGRLQPLPRLLSVPVLQGPSWWPWSLRRCHKSQLTAARPGPGRAPVGCVGAARPLWPSLRRRPRSPLLPSAPRICVCGCIYLPTPRMGAGAPGSGRRAQVPGGCPAAQRPERCWQLGHGQVAPGAGPEEGGRRSVETPSPPLPSAAVKACA